MKTQRLRLLLALPPLLAASALLSIASAKDNANPPEKPTPRLQAKVSIFRDGGTRSIRIPAHGNRPATVICIDHELGTKTPGEIFLDEDFQPGREGKQLSWEKADAYFKQLEQALIAHFGAAKLLEIVLNPIQPGCHLTEEEFVKRTEDPDFNDRLEAQYLMDAIISYRNMHGPAKGK